MSTTAKTAGRNLASNWDLALTSGALLLIIGGLAAPHLRRLFADGGDPRDQALGAAVVAG
jgi:hypothetical protein